METSILRHYPFRKINVSYVAIASMETSIFFRAPSSDYSPNQHEYIYKLFLQNCNMCDDIDDDIDDDYHDDIDDEMIAETNERKVIYFATPISSSSSSSSSGCEGKIKKKQRTKRVVTTTKRWTFKENELQHENQVQQLNSIFSPLQDSTTNFIKSQIKQKLRGYKEQDIRKKRYNTMAFITFNNVVQKLKDCQLLCYYCKYPVSILYEHVREPTQWTVERIDNTMGHNYNNVEIACLTCNIKRKTMHFERYLMTKQLCQNVVKVL